MKWTLIDDPLETKSLCYYIETDGFDYVAEITHTKRTGTYELRLYNNDTLADKPKKFMSFTRAKRSGQTWMARIIKKDIKSLENTLKDLQRVE